MQITGTPKEFADLVREIQDRQKDANNKDLFSVVLQMENKFKKHHPKVSCFFDGTKLF